MISVKGYTKFAFDYLHKILIISEETPKLEITNEEFMSLLVLLQFNDQKFKSKDLQNTKTRCVEMLTLKFVNSLNSSSVESAFLMLMSLCKKNPELFVEGVIEAISLHPEECLRIWKLNFGNYNRQNAFIFNYLGE